VPVRWLPANERAQPGDIRVSPFVGARAFRTTTFRVRSLARLRVFCSPLLNGATTSVRDTQRGFVCPVAFLFPCTQLRADPEWRERLDAILINHQVTRVKLAARGGGSRPTGGGRERGRGKLSASNDRATLIGNSIEIDQECNVIRYRGASSSLSSSSGSSFGMHNRLNRPQYRCGFKQPRSAA